MPRLRDTLKFSRKTFFNPSGWLDVAYLKNQNRTIWGILKSLFTSEKPNREESFEEAIKRLGLTEEEVVSTQKTYRLYALFFVCLTLALFIYAFYLLFYHGTLAGWLLALATSALFAGQAFRYDFWSYQMRRRRLGVTFKEWKNSILGGKE